jgi:hypothetical protein
VNHDEWPGVGDSVAVLRETFGNAYVEHTGGGRFCICAPIERLGFLSSVTCEKRLDLWYSCVLDAFAVTATINDVT